MLRSIGIIGAPSSAGAYAPEPERTPAAFRHGLIQALENAGCAVNDRGDIATLATISTPLAVAQSEHGEDIPLAHAEHMADAIP